MFLGFILIVIFILFVLILMLMLIDWLSHMTMTKDNCKVYGWGNYEKFVKEFNKYNWNNKGWNSSIPLYEPSFWDENNNSKLHANIIQFNKIGMLINNPIDLVRVKLFLRKYYKETVYQKKLHKW